ncbi:MAG: hypothetical protein V4721_10370 [Bacteroidota bacterium]
MHRHNDNQTSHSDPYTAAEKSILSAYLSGQIEKARRKLFHAGCLTKAEFGQVMGDIAFLRGIDSEISFAAPPKEGLPDRPHPGGSPG